MSCIAAVMLLAACGNGEAEEEHLNTSSKATKIGIVPVEECLPLLVAEHLGLLDSLHADVRVMRYGSLSDCRKALDRHEVDAILSDSDISYKLLASKKARIHRISQLSDKVIAADGEGYSKRLVEQNIDSLLKLDRHIFLIKVEDLNVRTKMLTSNSVDAAILPEPYASQAIKAGAVELKIKDERTKARGGASFGNKLKPALTVACDSIKKYGKENYAHTLDR